MRWLMLLGLLIGAQPSLVAGPITALSYSPDGAMLAAAEGNTVHLFDMKTRQLKTSWRNLPGRVSGVKFATDFQLAVAYGQVGQSGIIRLYDLKTHATPPGPFTAEFTAHQDAIYALDFSPDGQLLATGSYDRKIKLWQLHRGGKPTLRQTLTDHSDSVYAVAFHPKEPLLASGAADRSVKVWNTQTGARLYTLGDSTDWVYAVAWSQDGKQLVAGGVDRSLRAWTATATAGQLRSSAFAHDKPISKLAFDPEGMLYSVGEDRQLKSWKLASLTEQTGFPRLAGDVLSLAVSPKSPELVVGLFPGQLLLLDRRTGKQLDQLLPLKPAPKSAEPPPLPDRFPSVMESGSTDAAGSAMRVKLPVTIAGQLDRPGDMDFFRFELAQGQELGVELLHRAGGAFVPWLSLTDASGRVLRDSPTGLLGFVAPQAGTYAVAVRDRDFRGSPQLQYKLSLGPIPIVQGVFPLAISRGQASTVQLRGVNLPPELAKPLTISPPNDAGESWPLFTHSHILGVSKIPLRDGPTVTMPSNHRVKLNGLGSVNGVLNEPNAQHEVEFLGQANQPLVVEVHAARLGSPVDSYLEILDERGELVPRVQLRGVAKTFVTFRDHDSRKPGIRLDAWNEFAMDDYVLIGPELARIKALPKGPDDDCQFYSIQGQRAGQLGTTPVHQALGTPVIKVEFHPPTAQLPPNGFPTVMLNYANDDGGPRFGKDSWILFTPPKTGQYRARLREATNAGSPLHAYRLTIREPSPSFNIQFSPMNPTVRAGEGLPVNLTATRLDGFDGPIQVGFSNVPAGWQIPSVTIGAGQESTSSQFFVPEGTTTMPSEPIKLVAKAMIQGKTLSRELTVGLPKLAPRGDLTTSTNVKEVLLQPGGEARLIVTIQRQGDFQGRVPLDVRGLPHGVRVMNIGLNGILITPNVTQREIVLYAEPWVKPQTEPIVVLSRSERKGTEHAAAPVLLRIGASGSLNHSDGK